MDLAMIVREHETRIRHEALRFRGLFALDDLLQEGRIAVILAARAFDPKRGIKFWSYAQRAVRNRYLRLLNEKLHRIETTEYNDEDACAALTTSTPESQVIAREILGIALSGLTADEIDLIEKRFVTDEDSSNVAEARGTTYAAIYCRIRKLLAAMNRKVA